MKTLLDQKLNSRLNAIAEDKLPSIYDLKLEDNSLRPPIEGLPIYLGFQCEACERFFLSQSTFQRNHKGCSKVRAVSTVLFFLYLFIGSMLLACMGRYTCA